jgi:hypothetical protein
VYAACLFCHRALGANDAIETFPVGKRLAFDAWKGRLWVVCPHCAQWNLTPIEERWEAVEQCERLFRGARLRASTAEIGIARLPSGLDLIRIGKPLRPEFVAWRYGSALRRRRRFWRIGAGAALAVPAALVGTALATGTAIGGTAAFPIVFPAVGVLVGGAAMAQTLRGVRRMTALRQAGVPAELFEGVPLSRWQPGPTISFARDDTPDGWHLHFENIGHRGNVSGTLAYVALGLVLPTLNPFGATRSQVDAAVAKLNTQGSAAEHFRAIITDACRTGHAYTPLSWLPPAFRLSLEMAAHEETERRALEGELAMLAEQWRRAEAIAGIADNLLP